MNEFFNFNEENCDILSKCLNCGCEDYIPDFIYDECSRKIFHQELKKEIYTLNCNRCNKEKVVPLNQISDEY